MSRDDAVQCKVTMIPGENRNAHERSKSYDLSSATVEDLSGMILIFDESSMSLEMDSPKRKHRSASARGAVASQVNTSMNPIEEESLEVDREITGNIEAPAAGKGLALNLLALKVSAYLLFEKCWLIPNPVVLVHHEGVEEALAM